MVIGPPLLLFTLPFFGLLLLLNYFPMVFARTVICFLLLPLPLFVFPFWYYHCNLLDCLPSVFFKMLSSLFLYCLSQSGRKLRRQEKDFLPFFLLCSEPQGFGVQDEFHGRVLLAPKYLRCKVSTQT